MIPRITFLQSPYQNARDARYALRAIVSHRIVGSLPSARYAFGVVVGDPGRSASSHFGIGFVGGALTIDQYVPLDRMAWTNGDVRDPSWSRIIPGVNPNLYTVTIEHEDGGYAGMGVVVEELWRASMELQTLLLSGNAAAIRGLGIVGATDAMVAQMAAIPKDESGLIDHNQIAGPNKPYCFRRWLDEPGFVEGAPSKRDRLRAAVAGGEEEVPTPLIVRAVEWTTKENAPFWTGGPGTGEQKAFIGVQAVDSIGETLDNLWRLVRLGREFVWMRRSDLIPDPAWPTYDAAVFSVLERGAAALTVTGLTETQAKAREKAAAAAVKAGAAAGANTAAGKYGA